jgi:DNA-binding transcriptional LysR family regulator
MYAGAGCSYKLRLMNTMVTELNLANVDLDLFLVLHTVMEEQSATRAAERLNVSRPAVSNAIARLRLLLKDQLLVRSSRGLVPTPLAVQIAPHVATALTHIRSALEAAKGFDPATTTRRFTIASSDYEQLAFLPRVVAEFRRRLPQASLRVISIDQMLRTDGLTTGEVDLFLGASPSPLPAVLGADTIAHDDVVCILRRDHPRVARKLPLDLFFELSHVEIALLGDRPSAGRLLANAAEASLGRVRRIAVSVPNFTSAAMAVVASDCVAAVPRRLAALFVQIWPLRVLKLPIDFPPVVTQMVWHVRTAEDVPVRFLRRMITDTATRKGRHKERPMRQGGQAGGKT